MNSFLHSLYVSSFNSGPLTIKQGVSAASNSSFSDHLYQAESKIENNFSMLASQPHLSSSAIQHLSSLLQLKLQTSLYSLVSDNDDTVEPPLNNLSDICLRNTASLIPVSKFGHSHLTSPAVSDADNHLQTIIDTASVTYGVEKPLIVSVIKAESNFNPDAESPKGALGLMQLMPATARELGVSEPLDPVQNIMGGTKYLKQLLHRYDGNTPLALAAYNWGMGNLERNPDKMPDETVEYVKKVINTCKTFKI